MKDPLIASLLTATLAMHSLASIAQPRLEFSLQAASDTAFSEPHDIVLSPDGALLYVADNNAHRIVVLDAVTLARLGSFAEDEVSAPHDVVFDAAGRLLVADTGNSRIAIYEVDGTGGRLLGELSGGVRRPEGVDVHPDGRVLATGAASGNLVVWRDGVIVGEADGFSSPHDVVVMPDGTIWVADAGNDRLVVLDDALHVLRIIEGPPYDFRGPRYLDFDADGRVLVADKYSHSVKVLGADGALLQVLGGPGSGMGEGLFDRPEGVEIHGDSVWFADTYNDRIVRYRVMPAP